MSNSNIIPSQEELQRRVYLFKTDKAVQRYQQAISDLIALHTIPRYLVSKGEIMPMEHKWANEGSKSFCQRLVDDLVEYIESHYGDLFPDGYKYTI